MSSKAPSKHERERIVERTVESYAACKTHAPTFVLNGRMNWPCFLEDFKEAISSLTPTAGSGLPYVIWQNRKEHHHWINDPDYLPVIARFVWDRLLKMSQIDCLELSPVELVKRGLVDPIRVFVKGEPHKASKLAEGRYRLIMSVSLVDQLVARVLFSNQNRREISLFDAIPSKPGMGLSSDGQVRQFTETLRQLSGAKSADELVSNWPLFVLPTDCSGFDWSVQDWMLTDEMEVRRRLTFESIPLLDQLRRAWCHSISNSVFMLSDGTLLAQTLPGIQKSGSYLTSSSNSRIRVMCAYHAGSSWAIAMGDDALEDPSEYSGTKIQKYKELGFKVEVGTSFEFCSMNFVAPSVAVPVNVGKMVYKLLNSYNPHCGSVEKPVEYQIAANAVLHELRHLSAQDLDFLSMCLLSGGGTK